MIFFAKTWWTGKDRDRSPGTCLEPQPDVTRPQFRPGWKIQYLTSDGKKHIGIIRYVYRSPDGTDFYAVNRVRDESREITFDHLIIKRIKIDKEPTE